MLFAEHILCTFFEFALVFLSRTDVIIIFKEGLQSVLHIGSAHDKGGSPNINMVQISHFSNSF